MSVDAWGWVGTALSLLFYLLLAYRRVKLAYVALCLAAVLWAIIGGMLAMPSLVFKEAAILALIVLGWRNWSKV